MNTNFIEWPRAQYWEKCWNPWIGCHACSPACSNCYANTLAHRFGMSFRPHATKQITPPRSGVVFCGNMTDLFGYWMLTKYQCYLIDKTLGHSETATYLWLTKRPRRMMKALQDGIMRTPNGGLVPFHDCVFGNQYFGMTVENQDWFENRFGAFLLKPNWAKCWLSAEPLLGPINLHLDFYDDLPMDRNLPYQWVVVGCESGPYRRPCKLEWVENLVYQCVTHNIPVFVKQLDICGNCVTDITKFPKHLQIRQVPWVHTFFQSNVESGRVASGI